MKYDTPKEIEVAKLKFNRKEIGMVFKKDARILSSALEALAGDWKDFEPIATGLEVDGKVTVDGYEVTKNMISWERTSKKIHEVKFTPSVIEPSFGMGRILYSLLEHSFYQRDMDEQRCVMKFNPRVAPQKTAVLPISSSPEFNVVVDQIAASLIEYDLATRVDTSTAALGRRYARSDELGVPFAITVDFDTLSDGTVTIRERDSMVQVRLPKKVVSDVIYDIVHGRLSWESVTGDYPVVQVDEGESSGSSQAQKGTTKAKKVIVVKNARGCFSRPAVVN
jgi:glycyl-tRNA synthetase